MTTLHIIPSSSAVFEEDSLASRPVGDYGVHGRSLEVIEVALGEHKVGTWNHNELMIKIHHELQDQY